MKQAAQLAGGHRLAAPVAGKQPAFGHRRSGIVTRWAGLPPLAQQTKRLRRQHDIAVLTALGLLDPDDLLRAVDMLDLQPDHLAGAQAAAIAETEQRADPFLKGLVKRGLKGVKLVISDAHDGLRHAITRVLGATWQRCRVHWMRNALAHVPKGQHTMVAAAIRQAFLQPEAEAAQQTWRHVADQLRPRWPKLGTLMDDSEHDVLAYITFPAQHRTKLHSINPLERLNKEVKRRADVVGIFPNEASITRLIGAVLLEQNDEWLLQCRYMQIEGMAELTPPLLDADRGKLPPMAA